MSDFFKRPYRFAITYSVLLVIAVSYVLLDTFVIPKGMVQVEGESSNVTSENKNSSSSSSGTNSSVSTEGTYTETSYKDDNISITLKESRAYETQYYVADIQIADVSYLKTAFANNTYGRNIKETTSEMAENCGAILAINGDYYGFRDYGYVLRNGTLYREDSNGAEDLAIMSDGSFQIIEEDKTSASSLLESGALQVLSFGPALVNDSEVVVGEHTEVAKAMTSNPRTAIGMISPLHYIIIVSDGRTNESSGLTLYQLAGLLQEEGCTVAYNLDGGGSSTLWFHGEVINNPTSGHGSGEREVSDIVYIGY